MTRNILVRWVGWKWDHEVEKGRDTQKEKASTYCDDFQRKVYRELFLVTQTVKSHLQCRRPRFDPWVGKMPWRRKWQPTPVFLPGEFHGRGSLVVYGPWGHNELDTAERLTLTLFRTLDQEGGNTVILWSHTHKCTHTPYTHITHTQLTRSQSIMFDNTYLNNLTYCNWAHRFLIFSIVI